MNKGEKSRKKNVQAEKGDSDEVRGERGEEEV